MQISALVAFSVLGKAVALEEVKYETGIQETEWKKSRKAVNSFLALNLNKKATRRVSFHFLPCLLSICSLLFFLWQNQNQHQKKLKTSFPTYFFYPDYFLQEGGNEEKNARDTSVKNSLWLKKSNFSSAHTAEGKVQTGSTWHTGDTGQPRVYTYLFSVQVKQPKLSTCVSTRFNLASMVKNSRDTMLERTLCAFLVAAHSEIYALMSSLCFLLTVNRVDAAVPSHPP